MKYNKKKFLWLVTSLVVLLIIIAGFFTFFAKHHSSARVSSDDVFVSASDALTAQKFWSGRIDKVGAAQAYQEFIKDSQSKSFGDQHLLAHMWGKLLYDKEGLNGIGVCDSSFAFGCYHGFLASAISTEGIGIVSSVDQKCTALFGVLGTGCQHGIGHGILEYLGHDQLEQSLEACLKTTQVNPLFGCTSGVFMEYNMPIVLTDTTANFEPRAFDPTQPYGPCSGITQEPFRLSCFYELGEWWNNSLDSRHMGALCKAVANSTEREVCYQGVGRIAAEANNYNVSTILTLCKAMPNTQAVTDCASGGAWSVFAEPSARANDVKVCEGLASSEVAVCISKADLICNYLNDLTIKQQCVVDNAIKP